MVTGLKAEHDAAAEDDGAGVDETMADAKRKREAATKAGFTHALTRTP